MKIDHVRLLVVHFQECFRFYRDIIGLEVLWGNEDDTYGSFRIHGSQVPNLAIFQRQAMANVLGTENYPLENPSQDRAMLIIGVDDVDGETKRLQSLGVHFVLEPRDYPAWGMRSAYLRDPDGNLIELTGSLPPDKWSPDLRVAAKLYDEK